MKTFACSFECCQRNGRCCGCCHNELNCRPEPATLRLGRFLRPPSIWRVLSIFGLLAWLGGCAPPASLYDPTFGSLSQCVGKILNGGVKCS